MTGRERVLCPISQTINAGPLIGRATLLVEASTTCLMRGVIAAEAVVGLSKEMAKAEIFQRGKGGVRCRL